MPISKFCATEFDPKWVGSLYTLRNPEDGYIFYVGKTQDRNSRLQGHIHEVSSVSNKNKNLRKCAYIKSLLDKGCKPIMGLIEECKIRTKYDELYYDYKEFCFIKAYLQYGWDLTNVRVNDNIYAGYLYKEIIEKAKYHGKISVNDFYYGLDYKGFPIYDLNKITKLGYRFSKEQFASHWAYIIDLEKYANIPEITHDYVYDDDLSTYREHNPINWDSYF